MEILTQIVNFFLGLGASVFVPFIMIIAGLIVRMKVKDAISSGITPVSYTHLDVYKRQGFNSGSAWKKDQRR